MHTDVPSVGLYHLIAICITDQVNVFSVRHLQLINDVYADYFFMKLVNVFILLQSIIILLSMTVLSKSWTE